MKYLGVVLFAGSLLQGQELEFLKRTPAESFVPQAAVRYETKSFVPQRTWFDKKLEHWGGEFSERGLEPCVLYDRTDFTQQYWIARCNDWTEDYVENNVNDEVVGFMGKYLRKLVPFDGKAMYVQTAEKLRVRSNHFSLKFRPKTQFMEAVIPLGVYQFEFRPRLDSNGASVQFSLTKRE